MQISANTSVKTIEGHFTWCAYLNFTSNLMSCIPNSIFTLMCFPTFLLRSYTKSVITKPQNVMVLRDIMCNGYVAGGNCLFFGTGGKKLVAGKPLSG